MKDMVRKMLMMIFHPAKMRSDMMTEAVAAALTHLHYTREDEYSCEDAYKVLDIYADMVSRGEDPSELMPLVKLHLEICGNFREEFEALLTILGEDSSAKVGSQ